MEGARWNRETHSIDESIDGAFHDSMPVILIRPAVRSELHHDNAMLYEAPVFKTSSRQSVTTKSGHSTNLITFFKLNTVQQPSIHWIFRGVALLCQLDD